MSQTDTTPPQQFGEWIAACTTFIKASDTHSKNLADDQKVKADKGDLLRARFYEQGNVLIIDEAVLNGQPVQSHIRVIVKNHWERQPEAKPAEEKLLGRSAVRRIWAKFINKKASEGVGG